MKLLKHENIVEFIDVFQGDNHVYIVQELLQLNLKEYLIKIGGKLSERESAKLIEMLAAGLSHIHKSGFIHFDIKVRNVLINLDENENVKNVKIADFGLASNEIEGLRGGHNMKGTI